MSTDQTTIEHSIRSDEHREILKLRVPSAFILRNSKTGKRVILIDIELLQRPLSELIEEYCTYPLYSTLNGDPLLPRELAQIWVYYRSKDVAKEDLHKIYNAIDDLNKANKIRSLPAEKLQQLVSLSSIFPKLLAKMLDDERIQYTRMKQISRYLQETNCTIRSFDLSLSKMTYRIQLPGKYVEDLQLDFLSNIETSHFIPCVTATSEGRCIHKVYNENDELALKWSKEKHQYPFQFLISHNANVHHAYYSDVLHSVFVTVTKIHDCEVIVLRVIEEIERVYRKIHSADVTLRYVIYHISGYFCIENIHLKNHHIFMEFLSTHPLRSIIKCDESQYTFAQRIQFRMKGVIESKITITIKEVIATGRTIVKKDGCSIKLLKGSPYTKVKLSGAKSLQSLEKMAEVMNKIIAEYLEAAHDLTKIYNKVLPYRKWVKDYMGEEIHGNDTGLIGADPELFTSKYSRAIQKFPPKAVSEKEAYYLLRKGHEVIRYPCRITNTKKQPKHNSNAGYYVSPFKDKPYLQLIPNKTLVNKNEHPWIIKCDVKRWLKSGIDKSGDWYVTLLSLHNPEQKSIINTEKLFSGCTSEVSITVKNLMSAATKHDTEFYRYCVIVSNSSIIHCLLYALRDKRYLSIEGKYDDRYIDRPKEKVTDELREDYVSTVRANMADTVGPQICLQQCYDMTVESITEVTADSSIYLDPTKYVKMVERYFKVNIFLITPAGDIIETRYNQFNVLNTTGIYDTTVVLMVHNGTECSPSEVPNCDLVICNVDKRRVYTYGKRTGGRLLDKTKKYCYISRGIWADVANSDIHPSLYKYQIIDSMGKMRAAITDQGMVMCISPSVPSHRPIYNKAIKKSKAEEVKAWTELHENTRVITAMIEKETIVGLLIAIDCTQVYVRIKNMPYSSQRSSLLPAWLNKLPKSHQSVDVDIFESQHGEIGTISSHITSSKCREVMRCILQVIYACNMSVPDFDKRLTESYMTIIEDYNAYQPTLRVIPWYDESNYMTVLRSWAPSFFYRKRIIVPSSKELMSARQYIKTLSYRCEIRKPECVESYYVHKTDFVCKAKESIYLSTEEMKEELELNSLVKPMQVLSRFSSDACRRIKYAYLCNFGDNTFIVQNVIENNLERAIQVSIEWLRCKVNIGYYVPVQLEDTQVYNVYEVENSVIICKGDADQSLPSVLKFTEVAYAALLKL